MPDRQTETSSLASDLRQLGVALHDLCQPLTTLQCRLEMAEMTNTPAAHREAVHLGLEDCERLAQAVIVMREAVRRLAGSVGTCEEG